MNGMPISIGKLSLYIAGAGYGSIIIDYPVTVVSMLISLIASVLRPRFLFAST